MEQPRECHYFEWETKATANSNGIVWPRSPDETAVLVYDFQHGASEIRPNHRLALEKLVKDYQLDSMNPRAKVTEVEGFSDCIANVARNDRLRQSRAISVRSYLIALGALSDNIGPPVDGRSAPQPGNDEPGEQRDLLRSARIIIVRSAAPSQVKDTVRVVAKSYIAPIANRIGFTPCVGNQPVLFGFAQFLDATSVSDPADDAKDKSYRLFTGRTFTVTRQGDTVANVEPSEFDTDIGNEPGMTPPPLQITKSGTKRISPNVFAFYWIGRGRPADAAENLAFSSVCPRTSVYIWHHVVGQIECRGEKVDVFDPLFLEGSNFPSHRVFVSGSQRGPTIPQNVLADLWVPSSSDPSMVAPDPR